MSLKNGAIRRGKIPEKERKFKSLNCEKYGMTDETGFVCNVNLVSASLRQEKVDR